MGERTNTYREIRGFPGERYQLAISVSMLLLSSTTFLALRYATLLGDAAFASSATLVFTGLFTPQLLDFRGMQDGLMARGVAVRGRQRRWVQMGWGGLFLVLVVGPFILLFVAPSTLWSSVVFGMIAGFSGFQTAFTIYVRRWEAAHRVRLTRFAVWRYDEAHRRVIVENGVRAQQHAEGRTR
jgi:hypothetical protein